MNKAVNMESKMLVQQIIYYVFINSYVLFLLRWKLFLELLLVKTLIGDIK